MVGERLGLDGAARQIVGELVFVPASVEAIGELLEVAIEVLVADAAEGSLQPGLEVGDDRVGPGQDLNRFFPPAQWVGLVIDARRGEGPEARGV